MFSFVPYIELFSDIRAANNIIIVTKAANNILFLNAVLISCGVLQYLADTSSPLFFVVVISTQVQAVL